ncbi:transcriptional regulator [uncultured Veillonella sp.]|uniref:helix-turn-helix transcriptional regulator n=1 Tax=uncultured Veillonella sp. TaxID=159268 RepID=UPI0026065EB3|nr:PAS domain-containing protein [uncultured Veillonella sp.]
MNHILEKYIPIVSFLGEALGPLVEVVLHDVTNPDASIIAIANGHISGRQVGGPSTDLILRMIEEAKPSNKNKEKALPTSYLNYNAQVKGNTPCRASSYFIRSEEGELLGCLCINVSVGHFLEARQLLDLLITPHTSLELLPSHTEDLPVKTETKDIENHEALLIYENLHNSIDDVIDTIVKESTSYSIALSKLSTKEKVKLIKTLNDKGLFNLKGGVAAIAAKMNVSEPTIYRYLSQAKKDF